MMASGLHLFPSLFVYTRTLDSLKWAFLMISRVEGPVSVIYGILVPFWRLGLFCVALEMFRTASYRCVVSKCCLGST